MYYNTRCNYYTEVLQLVGLINLNILYLPIVLYLVPKCCSKRGGTSHIPAPNEEEEEEEVEEGEEEGVGTSSSSAELFITISTDINCKISINITGNSYKQLVLD